MYQKGDLNHLHGGSFSGSLLLASCLALFHFITSNLTRALPETHVNLQAKWVPVGGGGGDPWEIDRTYYVLVLPLLFLTPKEPFCTCVVGDVSLTSRMKNMVFLSFYFSTAQILSIPAIKFSLEVLKEDKLQFTPLDKLQLLSPGGHLPSTSHPFFPGPQKKFRKLLPQKFLPHMVPGWI